MGFDLELDMPGLSNPSRKYCSICQVEMVPLGMDKMGMQSHQCPKCKMIYYEE